MIEVYDDFFDDDIHQEVYSKLMRPNWGISGNNPGKLEIFWHYEGLENEEYFSEYLYKKICNKLDTEFKGFERIYANGQTAGQYGTPHYDDGDLTFLYYPSPVWDTNWQGHLMFMNETDEVVRVVEHKSNRAVLFTGIIKHYADAPHRWFNGLRISLAYKLWRIKELS